MKEYLTPLIQEMLMGDKENGGPKTIPCLAVCAYLQGAVNTKTLDFTFMNILTANLKVFMVAGYDTIASILSHVSYVLSTHTVASDALFGPHPTAVTANSLLLPRC